MALEATTNENSRRDGHDVTREILECLSSQGPLVQARVIYGARLAFHQIKQYQEELASKGLIAIREQDGRWEITPKGKLWLKHATEIKKLEAVVS